MNTHFIKFANDTVIVNLLNNDKNGHCTIVHDFIAWSNEFHLNNNVAKTKNFIINFSQD